MGYCQQKSERVRQWQQTLRHELFEYEGRMSQLMKLVDIEVPQAIGALNRIVRNLEEYHAVRASDPSASYDDVAVAKAIWAEDDEEAALEKPDAEEVASAKDRDTKKQIESKHNDSVKSERARRNTRF